MSILKTRLFKPIVSKFHLIRESLYDKLGNNQYKPLITVVAPAGFGKSIFVSQWLDYTQENYSWVSLDEECNDFNTFINSLYESICSKLNVRREDSFEKNLHFTKVRLLFFIKTYDVFLYFSIFNESSIKLVYIDKIT